MKGHRGRILSMDMSPDGSSIVSVGADEVLRFLTVSEQSLCKLDFKAGKVSSNFPVIG